MAFLVADWVALLFVRGGALLLLLQYGGIVKPNMRRKGDSNLDINVHLNGCTVLFGHLPALLPVDCRAHLGTCSCCCCRWWW